MGWLSRATGSLTHLGKSATSDVGNFFGVGDVSRILGVKSPLPKAGAPIGMFGLPSRYSTPLLKAAGLAGGAYLGAGALGLTGGGAVAPAVAATEAGAIAPTLTGPAITGGGATLGAGTLYGSEADGTAASTAAATAAPSVLSSTGGFLSKYGVPLSVLGLGLISGKQKIPELNNLQDIAGASKDVGLQYLNAVKSGQLPPGYQAQYDQFLRSQTAATKQQYADMGMTGSTQEAEALQRVQDNAMIVRDQLMGSVLSQGENALGIATGPYTNIANVQLSQDQQAQQALMQFAMVYGLMQSGMGR